MNDIDRLAEQYATDESDAKAYQKAQAATIISQTKQINELRKKLEEFSQQNEQLTIENTRLKALNPDASDDFDTSDEETICVVQLAILKNLAMQRELTLEECKKTEIYVKTLLSVRGKKVEDKPADLSSIDPQELLAAMKTMGNS